MSKCISIHYLVHVPVRMHATQGAHIVLFPVTPWTNYTVIEDYLRFNMALLMCWEGTIQPHSLFGSQFQRCWVASVPSKISKSDDALRTGQALVFFLFWFHLKLTRCFFLCFLTQPFIMFDRVKECFFPPLVSCTMENIMPLLWSLCCYPAYKVRPLFLVSSLIKCVYIEQESCHGRPEMASSSYDSAQPLTILD